MIVSFIFIKFKDFLFLPPSRFLPPPLSFRGLFGMPLSSKYLGIFLMFFCYWPLNYFIVGKGHALYDWIPLRGFVSWPRIRSVLVRVPRGALHTLPDAQWVMRCPPLAAGNWERPPPACSSSFISSFPLRWVFPQCLVFSLLHSVTHSQMKTQGRRSPWLRLRDPLYAVWLHSPPQTHNLHSSPGKAPPSPWPLT